jgi:signal transduction histidine kinase
MAVEVLDELIAEVDGERLRQVLENLRVHDQGPGSAPAVLDTLMTRFVRGQHAKGLGLGLYLAQDIAAAHGGTLTVESKLGHGMTFQLAVPVVTS